MHVHTWSRIFISIIILVITIIMTVNYLVNPYNIFSPNHHTQYNRLKQDIVSDRMTFFYELKHVRPQTLMVGTSRIGYLKSNELKSYTPSPIFKLSLAGSSVYEQRCYIEYAIKNLPIKTIVWSLDFFSFNPTKDPYPSFSEDRLKRIVYIDDYTMALFSYRTFERSLKTLKLNHKNAPYDKNISEYCEGHLYENVQGQTLTYNEVRKNANLTLNEYATNKAFLKSKKFLSPNSIDPKLEDVAYILQLCKTKKIKCIIYTSPVFREHLDMIYSLGLGDTYAYWKKGLVNITPYWDFNTYNSISENIMNFRDSSHMISDNGKYIFAKLFRDQSINTPKDFGEYLSRENIDEHIRLQKEFVKPYIPLKKMSE